MPDTRLWHPFADMGAVRQGELVIDYGEDVWLWDREGRRYLDATASQWYANVGHGRREITDAVTAQMARLETYSEFADFANEPALELPICSANSHRCHQGCCSGPRAAMALIPP